MKLVSWLPADHSQPSLALSFTKWGGLLACFTEWNSPSITEHISYFQKVYVLWKTFHACYAFCRIFNIYYVYFVSSWNQTGITLKIVSDDNCGSVSCSSSRTVTWHNLYRPETAGLRVKQCTIVTQELNVLWQSAVTYSNIKIEGLVCFQDVYRKCNFNWMK